MPKFITNTGLISRDNSNITGSLTVTGQVIASHFGTSSYVVTSSYSINSGNTLYTDATNIATASYATTAVTASVALTASIMRNPGYGPTQGIGWISPNITLLGGVGSTTATTNTFTSSFAYGGFYPFMVNKDCTVVTMSMLGATGTNNTTCSLAIYSNSTSSLPEYLLVTGSIRIATSNTTVLLYNASNFTPIKLYANNVYWIAYTSTIAGGVYHWRPAFYLPNTSPSYNPLLGYAISTSGSTLTNFISPLACIKSASYISTFPATASQQTASYVPTSGSYVNQFIQPFIRVTYP